MVDPLTPDVFASPAVGILCDLEREGFRVELKDDDAILIAPSARLTPERRAEILRWKDALKLLIRICDDVCVQDRREAFRYQFDGAPAGWVPAFLFRPGVPYVMGVCYSCGDALPEPRFGRCWRCAVAWRLAVGTHVASDVILAEALDTARCA